MGRYRTSRAIYPRPFKICEICKKEFEKPLNAGKTKWEKRRFCSKKCQYQDWVGRKNEKSYAWKEKVGIYGVHFWLYRNYGKANKCENINCIGKSKWFDWAKITNKEYEKKRENFMMLCRKCHRKYDMTEEKKAKATKNLHWYKGGG